MYTCTYVYIYIYNYDDDKITHYILINYYYLCIYNIIWYTMSLK